MGLLCSMWLWETMEKNMKCLVLVQREKGIRNTTDYFSMSFVLCVPFTSVLLCTLYLVQIVSCSYKNSKLVGWLLSAYQVERLGLLSSEQGETDCFSAHLHSLPKRKKESKYFFTQYPCSIQRQSSLSCRAKNTYMETQVQILGLLACCCMENSRSTNQTAGLMTYLQLNTLQYVI